VQFGGQEPGTNAEIQAFAKARGAQWPIFAKWVYLPIIQNLGMPDLSDLELTVLGFAVLRREGST
jgi:hypothetical protein